MSEIADQPSGGATAGDAEGAGADGPGFGLTAATALIVGSIIGVGIFNLPSSLATYGPISLVSMALTTVGAVALALLFASLSRRLPADGGPYAYAGSPSATGGVSPTPGRTGSPRGPATPPSRSVGCCTSRSS
jgi:basic amino acid/polyamine antiporter, APA family